MGVCLPDCLVIAKKCQYFYSNSVIFAYFTNTVLEIWTTSFMVIASNIQAMVLAGM